MTTAPIWRRVRSGAKTCPTCDGSLLSGPQTSVDQPCGRCAGRIGPSGPSAKAVQVGEASVPDPEVPPLFEYSALPKMLRGRYFASPPPQEISRRDQR